MHRTFEVPRCIEDLTQRFFSVLQDQHLIFVPVGTSEPNYKVLGHISLREAIFNTTGVRLPLPGLREPLSSKG